MATYSHPNTINLGKTVTNICDTNGELLFFTNGLQICDKNGMLMPNGDSLSPGLYANSNMGLTDGLNCPQGAIILPMPYYGSKYVIFHELSAGSSNTAIGLLYSIVDMSQMNGLGDVISKNNLLISDTLSSGGLTAVRHSNNRDWWLLVPQVNHASFYRILVNPEGVWLDGEQEIGEVHLNGDYNVRFSPDGTKYAYVSYCPDLLISLPVIHISELFNFDRSSGLLSDPKEFSFYDTNTHVYHIAFSPNSNLLYASLGKRIYQWDTESMDMDSSMTIVGEWDGSTWGWAPTYFNYCQLAPDNKIYFNSAPAANYLHVIDKPDIPGIGCNVIQRYIHFSNDKPITGMPNFPDFRLGSVTAIPELEELKENLNFSPNPASDFIQFQVIGKISHNVTLDVEIIDNLGRQLAKINSIQIDESYRVCTSSYPPGLYIARIVSNNKTLLSKKFLVIH